MGIDLNPKAYIAFQNLTRVEWSNLQRDLLAYTINLVRYKYWRHGILPKGYAEQDIVQDIFLKTLTGERSWDPEVINLRTFLMGQVRSFVSHLFEWKEYKHESHIDSTDDDLVEIIDKETHSREENGNPYTRSPGELLLLAEQKEERDYVAKKKVDAILEVCGEETDLAAVFEAGYELLLEGKDVCSRYLAERLGVPRQEIYNRTKRLNRLKDKAERELMKESEVEK
jgi:DNA-directed RNA polymerase specialized sigma24 family protein